MAHNNLGIALREQGQSDEALVHFQRAVDLEPGFAPAQSNLGQLLLNRGESEAALVHCQEAVRLQPDTASLHHNLGNVLRVLERYVDARAAYLEALRINPNLAPGSGPSRFDHAARGKAGRCIPWLKRATELEPANSSFWEWLAELYDELEEPSDSILCWQRVLALSEERSGPHIALGWALQEEGRLDEAASHYHAALELQPDAAMAHLNLGGLHEELGDLAAAEVALRTGYRSNPTSPCRMVGWQPCCAANCPTTIWRHSSSGWPTTDWAKVPRPLVIRTGANASMPEAISPGPRTACGRQMPSRWN